MTSTSTIGASMTGEPRIGGSATTATAKQHGGVVFHKPIETRIAQPSKHQISVYVVATRHLQNRDARNPRLRHNLNLLFIFIREYFWLIVRTERNGGEAEIHE